jgi:hypothetical protein
MACSSAARQRRDYDARSPRSALAPRFGMAHDVTGKQKLVFRGGAVFFDRPFGNW